jgi:hypothetical protein
LLPQFSASYLDNDIYQVLLESLHAALKRDSVKFQISLFPVNIGDALAGVSEG